MQTERRTDADSQTDGQTAKETEMHRDRHRDRDRAKWKQRKTERQRVGEKKNDNDMESFRRKLIRFRGRGNGGKINTEKVMGIKRREQSHGPKSADNLVNVENVLNNCDLIILKME